ncbi:protein prenyltransferase alpha subunit repeat-containing protein 1 [Pararge aegeria]|uniref:Jg8950 protein n=3 Tax=Pararge aegeria TaxID=116150 RepID=A0A8S4SDG4_9NEOP|nr:protein prenyltransferase alpha subunit repeat-containing protein 1 [Pararge aegeria]CAH2257775.1 jg8950 [Pararge aegeria aegeria]
MEEDKLAFVEKIIKDVQNVLTKLSELYAFDVVPMDNNYQNKSPVLYLENCLGLESWCVKHVYMYCYSELMDKYCIKPNRKSRKIPFSCERLIKLLNVTLLLNPEINSLWNKRREMTLQSLLDRTGELHFARLVLSRKPKCNEAFSYRRWLLEPILQDNALSVEVIGSLVNDEIMICNLASDKSPNNYHSWNHRTWLLNRLKTMKSNFDLDAQFIKEYHLAEKWTSEHVSDFSCFHYYQFCIKNICSFSNESWRRLRSSLNIHLIKVLLNIIEPSLPKQLIIDESDTNYPEESLIKQLLAYTNKNCKCVVDFVKLFRKIEILFHSLVINDELVRFYKHHETLWYHRRFILHEIFLVMYEHFGLVRHNGSLIKKICTICNFDDLRQMQAKIVKYDSNHVYSSSFFKIVLSHEKTFIEERRSDGDNYADKHEKYLKYVEGLSNVI